MTDRDLIARYAQRLGLAQTPEELVRRATGPVDDAVALLDELLEAHTRAIVFENLDVAGLTQPREESPVAITQDAVAAKLLEDCRGGYCHEHAVMIRGVLTALGFTAHALLGRIARGPEADRPRPLTHQATLVVLGERRFLVDPGFGAGTPDAAVEISADSPLRRTPRGEYRVVPVEQALPAVQRADSAWALQARQSADQDFRTLYSFALTPRTHEELEQANRATSTRPGTKFTGAPILARYQAGRGKTTLAGRDLKHVRFGTEEADEQREERTLQGVDDFVQTVATHFDVRLEPEEAHRLWASIEEAEQ